MMGEYAKYRGQSIKIGTCESMYYLRADQVSLLTDSDIRGYETEVRFRFPFPDEDHIEPGQFEDYDRGIRIPDWKLPQDFSGHYSVQFKAEPGYLLSIPCPESIPSDDVRIFAIGENGTAQNEYASKIHRNGWHGGYMVKQQKIVNGLTVTVVACGSCGAAWRLPTYGDGSSGDAQPVVEAFRTEADREEWRRLSSDWDITAGRWGDSCNYGFEPTHGADHRSFLHAMADRIEAGYKVNDRAEVNV